MLCALWVTLWIRGWAWRLSFLGHYLFLRCFLFFFLRCERLIGGSGIPQVEIMIHGDLQMKWWRVLVTKFLGALTSLAGGLSLGREGTCIMIGASLWGVVGCFCNSLALASRRRFLGNGDTW